MGLGGFIKCWGSIMVRAEPSKGIAFGRGRANAGHWAVEAGQSRPSLSQIPKSKKYPTKNNDFLIKICPIVILFPSRQGYPLGRLGLTIINPPT